MIKFQIDYENNAEQWWDALWVSANKLADLLADSDEFEVSAEDGAYLLELAKSIPGWEGGPSHAPHPLIVAEVEPPAPLQPAAGRYGGGR